MTKRRVALFVVLAAILASLPLVFASPASSACPFELPEGSTEVSRQVFPQPASMAQPVTVTFCSFTAAGVPQILIRSRYIDPETAKSAESGLGGPDGYLYLGVPSVFYPTGAAADGVFPGEVVSDDCGVFDPGHPQDAVTGCPSGLAALARSGRDVWVLVNRFETGRPQLEQAPAQTLASLLGRRLRP